MTAQEARDMILAKLTELEGELAVLEARYEAVLRQYHDLYTTQRRFLAVKQDVIEMVWRLEWAPQDGSLPPVPAQKGKPMAQYWFSDMDDHAKTGSVAQDPGNPTVLCLEMQHEDRRITMRLRHTDVAACLPILLAVLTATQPEHRPDAVTDDSPEAPTVS
jgi:hypothetical protein